MIKYVLLRERLSALERCTRSCTEDAKERWKEKGIPFDHKTALAFIKDHRNLLCGHIGLKLVPYQYHPIDLGFDELSSGVYIMNNRITGIELLYDDPDPVNKSFDLSIKLDNEGGIAEVPYKLTVDSVKLIE